MNAHIVSCPECGKRLQVRASLPPGKRVICPACDRRFVPAAAPQEKPAQPGFLAGRGARIAALLLISLVLAGGGFFWGRNGASAAPVPAAPTVVPSPAVCAPEHPQPQWHHHRKPHAAATQPTRPEATPAPVPVPPPPIIVVPNPPVVVAPAPPTTVDPQSIRAAFLNWMNQGSVATLNGNYDEAQHCYTQALQLAPNTGCGTDNQVALGALRQAGYVQAMSGAEGAMRAADYHTAVHDYKEALLKAPGDAAANNGLVQARSFAMNH